MIGAIAGDFIGSAYEFAEKTPFDFPLFQEASRFTDDTVLTVAIAEALLEGQPYAFTEILKRWTLRYPERGYGGSFKKWALSEDPRPYGSYGNGSAMRVSPIGFAFDSEEQVLRIAEQSAAVTHNHPEGIKGAKAVALCVFFAKSGASKNQIAHRIHNDFGYELSAPIEVIRQNYDFDMTCQGSVPQAIRAFLESEDYESAVRLAVWLGGDSDTLACIAGSIAEAFYGSLPLAIERKVLEILPEDIRKVARDFREGFFFAMKNL